MLKINAAEIYHLENMVDYQEGSVVSRELIQKPTGTITVFAFAEGQGLSEHTAPFDALVMITDGEAEVIIGGAPQTVAQGEIIILPKDVTHALKAKKRFKMVLTMIR